MRRTVSDDEWQLDETLLSTTRFVLTGRSQIEDITVGRTVQVVLSDDMVQTCKPGMIFVFQQYSNGNGTGHPDGSVLM